MRNLLLLCSTMLALFLLWSASRPIVAVQQPSLALQSIPAAQLGNQDLPQFAPASVSAHSLEPALALNQMVGPRLRVQPNQAVESYADQLAAFVARFTAKPRDEDVLILPQGKVIDLRNLGQSVLVVHQVNGDWYFDEY